MTSRQVRGASTPGEVVRERLREVRKRRKLNATQAAEMFGDPAMSATVLMNIEAGRRQTGATVDELIRFAYVLGVPPEALLVGQGEDVQVAPGVVIDSARFLRWVRGQEALPDTDTRHYHEVTAESLKAVDRTVPQDLRDEFLTRAQAAFDGFFADSEKIQRKTRQQVRDVLSELRSAVVSGVATEELLGKIDSYLGRLE